MDVSVGATARWTHGDFLHQVEVLLSQLNSLVTFSQPVIVRHAHHAIHCTDCCNMTALRKDARILVKISLAVAAKLQQVDTLLLRLVACADLTELGSRAELPAERWALMTAI